MPWLHVAELINASFVGAVDEKNTFHGDRALCNQTSPLTATVTATAASYGELPPTLADDRPAMSIQRELWRTSADANKRT